MKKRIIFYCMYFTILVCCAAVTIHANRWHTQSIENRTNAATEKITTLGSQLEALNIQLEEQEKKLTEQEIQNEKLRLTNIAAFNTAITVYNLEAQKYNQALGEYANLEKTYNTAVDEQKALIENVQKEFFLREYFDHIRSKFGMK